MRCLQPPSERRQLLDADVANRYFGSAPGEELATLYWAPLASYLTHLQLNVTEYFDIFLQGISALCQLTALQELSLTGSRQWCDVVSFSFPQLIHMYIKRLEFTELKLDCPQLLHIRIKDVQLGHLIGLGRSLESMVLENSMRTFDENEGLLPDLAMDSLVGLQSLEIMREHDTPKVRDEELLRNIRHLTSLTSLLLKDMWVESQALPTVLPASLQRLELNISDANEGIPQAIEALPSLQRLCLVVAAENTKLTRPLIPFLQMTRLTSLDFCPAAGEAGLRWIEWEPQALQLIAQALVEIQDSGSQLQLKY